MNTSWQSSHQIQLINTTRILFKTKLPCPKENNRYNQTSGQAVNKIPGLFIDFNWQGILNFPDLLQNSLTFPAIEKKNIFPSLFHDHGNPEKYVIAKLYIF